MSDKWKGLRPNWHNCPEICLEIMRNKHESLIHDVHYPDGDSNQARLEYKSEPWADLLGGVCSSWWVWSCRADWMLSVSRGDMWIVQCCRHLNLQLFTGLSRCEEQGRNYFIWSSHLSRVWSKIRSVMLDIPGCKHHHSIYACAQWKPACTSPSKWVKNYSGTLVLVGRDSSVGIATRYELDGPFIESRCGRDFPHPSRPALGPNQPPIQWVPGRSRGQSGQGVVLVTHPHLA